MGFDVEFESGDEGGVELGRAKDGEDVFEEDAGAGEVWILGEGVGELQFETGESKGRGSMRSAEFWIDH